MSPEAWIGIIAGIVIPIVGWIIYHALHDREVQSDLKSRVARIERDIGDHDSGMRGHIHSIARELGKVKAVAYFIGRKLKLDVMKDLDDDK